MTVEFETMATINGRRAVRTTVMMMNEGWRRVMVSERVGKMGCWYVNKFLYSYFFLIESDDDERWAVTTSIRWWWRTSQNRRPCTVPAVQDASSNSGEFFCTFFIYLSNVLYGCRQHVHRLSTVPHQIQAAAPPRHHLRRCPSRPSLDVDGDSTQMRLVPSMYFFSLFFLYSTKPYS